MLAAGAYAASPQLTRWWLSMLAERLGITLLALDVSRPGLHGLQVRRLEAMTDQARLALADVRVSYDLRGLLAGRLQQIEVSSASLTLSEVGSGGGTGSALGTGSPEGGLAGWTDRVPVAAVDVQTLEILAPHAGFAAAGALHYGADGLALSLAGREPQAARRLDLGLSVSPAGVVGARLADRERPEAPFLALVSSLAGEALSVEAEVALSGYPLELASELAGLPSGTGAVRASLSGRLPWPVPTAGLWQVAAVSGPLGADWTSADGNVRIDGLGAFLDLRQGVLQLRTAGRLRLQRGGVRVVAQIPEGYALRFDGSSLQGGSGLALRVDANAVANAVAKAGAAAGAAATGEAQITAFALTPGSGPALRVAADVTATAGATRLQGTLQLEGRRTAAATYAGTASFSGSGRSQRIDLRGTVKADAVLGGGKLQISGDAETETLGTMAFEARYVLQEGSGRATLQGATQVRGPLLSRVVRGWQEPWDLDAGRLGYALDLSWRDPAEVGGRVRISFVDVSAHYGSIKAQGFDGEFSVRRAGSAWIFEETPITVATVDVGVAASEVSAFVAWNGAQLNVRGATAALLGGGIAAAPFSYYPATGYGAIDLRLVELSLAEVLALEGDDISGTGRLDGTLPIRLLGNAASVEGGRIRAVAPGGSIRVSEQFRVPSGQPGLDFALRALHDFDYSQLEADVEYAENGDLQLAVRLRGRNPDVEGGRPIHYNLNVNENVPLLLKSLRLQDRVTREVERRVRN